MPKDLPVPSMLAVLFTKEKYYELDAGLDRDEPETMIRGSPRVKYFLGVCS